MACSWRTRSSRRSSPEARIKVWAIWAIWAACGYATALLIMWRARGQAVALLVSVAVAVVAPLLWLSYNPYLPVMTVFGLLSAAGLRGLAGNPGIWLALGTVVPLAAAFWIARPHRHCLSCRRDALQATAIAVVSPVIGLNLAVITTDPPVLAFMLLALALSVPAEMKAAAAACSGAALGVACDLKSTAWLAVPVMAAMVGARDGVRAAVRFTMAAVITTVVLTVALAPATVVKLEAAEALVQNSVLFPLGLTHDRTPAGTLLPAHVLTGTGTAGHVVSVGLLLAAGLAIAISLVIRPPRDVSAAGLRLAARLGLD